MEVVQLLLVTSAGSPGLAAAQKGGEHYCSVNFEFGDKVNSSSLPKCLPEPPKRTAGLGDYVV